MPEATKEQIKRFMKDETMSRAVRSAIRLIFLKTPKTNDVQTLAAAWLAKDRFEEAWRELTQISKSERGEVKVEENIGL